MLESHQIKLLIDRSDLIIKPFDETKNLKGDCIMLHLANFFKATSEKEIDTKSIDSVEYTTKDIPSTGYKLKPNEFILTYTEEHVTMPKGYMGWIETRGTMANLGLQAHFCDAHIDQGSSLQIAIQVKNNSDKTIVIYPGMYLIKMYLVRVGD